MLDPTNYCDQLQKKLLELRELVEANIVESAAQQKLTYYSGNDIILASEQKIFISNPREIESMLDWTPGSIEAT